MGEATVEIYLYDISNGMAAMFSQGILGKQIEGIWHTGVVVYGKEYFFGGGIQCSPAGQSPAGSPMRIEQQGTTFIPQELLEEFLREIAPRFTQATYSLLSHNCNNFSDEVAMFLTGKPIPSYITGLPEEALNTPGGMAIRPMIEAFETQMKSQFSAGGGMDPFGGGGGGGAAAPRAITQPTVRATVPTPTGHPHTTMALPCMHANKKALLSQDRKVGPALAKLRTLSAQSSSPLTSEEDRLLSAFETALSSAAVDGNIPLSINVPTTLVSLLARSMGWPSGTFPSLCVLRVIALTVSGSQIMCQAAFLDTLLFRLLRSSQTANVPTPIKLMALCTLSNLFHCQAAAAPLCTPEWLGKTLEAVNDHLKDTDKTLRMIASALAVNVSILMQPKESSSELYVAHIEALAGALKTETEAETAFRILLALCWSCFTRDSGATTVRGIISDLSSVTEKHAIIAKVREISGELNSLHV